MASYPSVTKCPKCGSDVTVIGWEQVQCTNPECKEITIDRNIYHD